MKNLITLKGLPLLAVFVLISNILNAQIGVPDENVYQGMGLDNRVNKALVLPDSTVMVVGDFAFCNERQVRGVARLNADGSTYTAFNAGTGTNGMVNMVTRQLDGKLVIGGDFTTYNGYTANRIARLYPDGSLDTSFNTGSGFDGWVMDIYTNPDTTSVIVGNFVTYNGDTINRIVKLRPNGLRDTSFNTGSGANLGVYAITCQADGKYVIGGSFTSFKGTSINRIIRLNSDGSADSTFNGVGSGAPNTIWDIAMLSTGKIAICGLFASYNGNTARYAALLNPNGSRYTGFNTVTNSFNLFIYGLAVQPDNKVVLTGDFTSHKGVSMSRIMRVDTTGYPDATFNPGTGLNKTGYGVALDPSGRIYVSGMFTLADNYSRISLVRFNTDGSIDHTFLGDSKLNEAISSIGVQNDGKIVVGGYFTRYNQHTVNYLCRLDNHGRLDTAFYIGSGANAVVRDVKVLANDKILICGDFMQYNGFTANRLARLNSDGTFDTTFHIGTGFNNVIRQIAVTDSGKIYAAGMFTEFNGGTANRIIRLNEDGTVDTTFNSGAGFDSSTLCLKIQPDGKLLVGGDYGKYNGTVRYRLVRLHPTGALESSSTFNASTIGNDLYAIDLQPDNLILLGGLWTNSPAKIRRVNTNGTTHSGYASMSGQINASVLDVVYYKSGMLIGGVFTEPVKGYAYADTTGALDTITIQSGPVSGNHSQVSVNDIFLDKERGRLFIGGRFSGIRGRLFNGFASCIVPFEDNVVAIDSISVLPSTCQGSTTKVRFYRQKYFNEGNTFTVQLSDTSGAFSSPTIIGSEESYGQGWDTVEVTIPSDATPHSNYKVRIVATNAIHTSSASSSFSIYTSPNAGVITSNKDTICPTKKFTLFVSGYSGSIQWQQKDSSNVWENICGATNDTLLIDSFWVTTMYRVIADQGTCGHDTSAPKTVYINPSFECVYEYNWYYLLVHVTDTNTVPVYQDSIFTNNDTLNFLLDEFRATKFYKPFDSASTPYLNEVYAIHCDGDVDSFYQRILDGNFFDYVEISPYAFYSSCSSPVAVNDPYTPPGYSTNWALDMVEAECAWTVTTGSPNVVIAVVDGEFEDTHEDLAGKFIYVHGSNDGNAVNVHGTRVASCIATNTNNGLGLAAVGYNTRLAGYLVDQGEIPTPFGNLPFITAFEGFWQAYQEGHRVILGSVSGIGCPSGLGGCPAEYPITDMVVQEMLNSGVTVIVASGNIHGTTFQNEIAGYGAMPGFIIVGGVNADNEHGPTGYNRYANIDLCGPAVDVPVANPSYAPGDGQCPLNSKYCIRSGTSFATPMVGGTIGLMLDINPCLGPQDIEAILRATTDPIDDGASFPGLLGTGRLNAYQACLAAASYTSYINAIQDILSSATWMQSKMLFGDVTIKSGVTLTISNTTIYIAQNRNIYVEPGAKLIIDNAILTGVCGEAWNGIIVEGNANQHQFATSGSGLTGTYHQGAVFLINNAILEHAVEAVKTDNSKSGGIIQATASTFRNNYIDIRTFPYRNFQPGNSAITRPNASRFDGCSFITNGGLTDAGIPTPLTHALLFGVHGIRFRGCTFANDATGLEYDYELGNGITSLDATYTVDYWCPPPHTVTCPGDEARSVFRNLRHGVYNLNWFNAGSAIIRRSLFENCVRGVRNEGVNDLQVTGNEFIMGNPVELTDVGVTPFGYDINEGIILHQCSGFKVEGNKFSGTTDIDNLTEIGQIGIRADGTGPDHNNLRNNKFEDMRFGNVANRQNRQDASIDLTGLEYTCNGNEDGLFDFYVAPQLVSDPAMALAGIQQRQGLINKPSENTFSGYSSYPILTDFLNLSSNAVTYYYENHNPGVYIDVVKTLTTGAVTCNYEDAGEFNFDDGLSGMSKPDLQAQFTANKSLHVNELALRKSLIDEGSTANLLAYLEERNNSTYSADVYDTLMALSPWLSEKVLKRAAVMEDALVNGKLWDVLMSNPDATVSGGLIALLRERIIPMPDSLIDSVIVNRATITPRTYLEDSIQRHNASAKEAAYEISNRILSNEDTIDYVMYRQWMDSIGEPRAIAEGVMSYFNTWEIDSVLPKFDSIYARYEITHEDSTQLNNIRSLLTWYLTWLDGFDSIPQADISQLDSMSLVELDTFASTENEFLKGTQMARSLINALYGGNYYTLPQLPTSEPEARKSAPKTEQEGQVDANMKDIGAKIKTYPNPAKEHVVFELKGRGSCTVEIYDLYSRKVSTFTVLEGIPVKVNTGSWPSGVYLWKSSEKDVRIGQGKLNVLRW